MKSLNILSTDLVAAVGQPHETFLTVTLNPGERPKYEFFPKEFVIESGDIMSVDLKVNNLDKSEYYIVGFCCTDTSAGVVEIKSAKKKMPDGSLQDLAELIQPLDEGTEHVTFKLNLRERQMVLIGIIVAIKRPGDADYKRYLCDPQVGNGPP